MAKIRPPPPRVTVRQIKVNFEKDYKSEGYALAKKGKKLGETC